MHANSLQKTGVLPGNVDSSSRGDVQPKKFQQAAGALAKVLSQEIVQDYDGAVRHVECLGKETSDLRGQLYGSALNKKNKFKQRCLRLGYSFNEVRSRSNYSGSVDAHVPHAVGAIAVANEPDATIHGQNILNSAVAGTLVQAGFNTYETKAFVNDKQKITPEAIEKKTIIPTFLSFLSFLSTPVGWQNNANVALEFQNHLKEVAYRTYTTQLKGAGATAELDQQVHRGKMLLIAAPIEKLRANHKEVSKFLETLCTADHDMRNKQTQSSSDLGQAIVSLERKLIA